MVLLADFAVGKAPGKMFIEPCFQGRVWIGHSRMVAERLTGEALVFFFLAGLAGLRGLRLLHGRGRLLPDRKGPCKAVTAARVHRLKNADDGFAFVVLLNPRMPALVPFAEAAMLKVLAP